MSAPQTEVLVFVDGQEVARQVLGVGVHTFGCASTCSIRIEAALVSDQHARLTVGEDGALLLGDLGSANGTFLNGQTITAPTPVAPNQTILIGTAQILVLQYAAHAPDDITVVMDGGGVPTKLSPFTRYELGPEIAKGGMGAVRVARQPAIRREVALKVMLRDPSGHDRLRFIEEAQITGQLEHPNIVPVHELALNEQGQPYYTMKLVKGSTLKDILKLLAQDDAATVAKYPLAALLTIFQKVCDAVAFAHAKGVIHRDLKPANIMVGEYGEVLVMDWGLAKVISGRDGAPRRPNGASETAETSPSNVATERDDQHEIFATLDGAVMGTPQYMSPEQARGEVATLDHRSDIFSLGAILYELVTFSPPFPGKTTRDILAKIKSGHFVLPNARLRSPGALRPHHLPGGAIPDSLEAVILKALALERDQRYQRVEEFQADLTAYQSGFATSAEDAGPWKQFKLFVVRHKGISTAVAASVLLISAISAAFTIRVVVERNRTAAQRDRAESEKQRAQKETANAEAAKDRFRAQLQEASRSDEATGENLFAKGNWSEGIAYFVRALQYDSDNASAALRLYQSITSYVPGNAVTLRAVLFHGRLETVANMSPDGTRILTAGDDKTARLWDATTGEPLGEPIYHEGAVNSAAFSPDGTRIVTASTDHTAQVWNAATCQPIGKVMRHEKSVESASFSLNGLRILTATSDSTVRVWDAATGKPLGKPMRHGPGDHPNRYFSPDGRRIVTAYGDGTILYVSDTATGRQLHLPNLIRHKGRINSVTFSADGTRILTASDDKTARLWDAVTGQPIGEPMRHDGAVNKAVFSPDGTQVITASDDKTARLWDAATGRPLIDAMHHESPVNDVIVSPNGKQIVTLAGEGNTARIWDAATGHPLGEVLDHEGAVNSVNFSRDGTRIVTASDDRTARLWNAVTGQRLGEPMRHERRVNSAVFSPDGTRIVTASDDRNAQLWNGVTSEPVGKPLRHEDAIYRASFSPDGTKISTASYDDTVQVWDVATGQPLGKPTRHERAFSHTGTPDARNGNENASVTGEAATVRIWDLATGQPLGEPMHHDAPVNSAPIFSPDGTRIVTAEGEGSAARIWDSVTGRPIGEPLHHEDGVSSALFSPDGARIVTASGDKTVGIWDASTGQPIGEPIRLEGPAEDAIFSPDGTRILTIAERGSGWPTWERNMTAQVWDVATRQPIGRPMHNEGDFPTATFSPDGTRIVTIENERSAAQLWDAATGQPLGEPMYHEGILESAIFSPDGTRIVTAASDKITRLWDVAAGQSLAEPMRDESGISIARFSPDGTRILTIGSGYAVQVWDTATGLLVGKPVRHKAAGDGATFSPDGMRISSIGQDNTVRFWDTATGLPIGQPIHHKGAVASATFSPDGMRIFTIAQDNTGQVWDVAKGAPLGKPIRNMGRFDSVIFNPDGMRVATTNRDTVQVWDAATGAAGGKAMHHEMPVQSASFSADGTRIVTVAGPGFLVFDLKKKSDVEIWDAATGQPIGKPMRDLMGVASAAFSPDGNRILTVSDGPVSYSKNTVRIWNAATGEPIGEPMHHESGINTATFSPDGAWIVTASSDKTARVWDAATGQPLGEPMRHEDSVKSAAFSPDGKRILTASNDGIARIWETGIPAKPLAPTPAWISEWAAAVAGWKFDAKGVMRRMPAGQRFKILYASHEGNDPWARLARWVALPPGKRTIHPDSRYTRREIAERERDFGSKESLESALRYDSTVPLARLLLAGFDTNPQRAAFLRDYDLKRVPDDAALWTRAATALAEQHDLERAKRAIDKLEKLAPDQASTLRTELGL